MLIFNKFTCIFYIFLRFHVAASKGLINSLNVFLDNGVNLKAVDAAGKTFRSNHIS